MPARAEINVTPMMDVMLVMLMIFMGIVPVIDAFVRLPPAANADPRPVQDGQIVLRIDAGGTHWLEMPDEWVAPSLWIRSDDDLRRELGRLYGGRTKDRVLYLKADKELPFGMVQQAIEIARASGVRVVATIVERRREGPSY